MLPERCKYREAHFISTGSRCSADIFSQIHISIILLSIEKYTGQTQIAKPLFDIKLSANLYLQPRTTLISDLIDDAIWRSSERHPVCLCPSWKYVILGNLAWKLEPLTCPTAAGIHPPNLRGRSLFLVGSSLSLSLGFRRSQCKRCKAKDDEGDIGYNRPKPNAVLEVLQRIAVSSQM